MPKEIIIVHYHLPEQSGLMIEEYWRGICARANEFNIPWKLEQISPSFYKKISDACFKDKGIILLGNEIKECVDLLRKNKIPCVLAGREANICKLCVTENRKDASWDLTKRLIDSGCKKIAFVGHFVSYNHQLARDGYVGALKESGYDYKFIVDTKVESVLHDIKSLINREPLLDGIVIIGAELCMKSLPVLLENQRNLKIGMFTENNLITQLKDTVYLAYYSQYEVGRLSVDLLKNAAEGKINCKTIQYAPYKILSPA